MAPQRPRRRSQGFCCRAPCRNRIQRRGPREVRLRDEVAEPGPVREGAAVGDEPVVRAPEGRAGEGRSDVRNRQPLVVEELRAVREVVHGRLEDDGLEVEVRRAGGDAAGEVAERHLERLRREAAPVGRRRRRFLRRVEDELVVLAALAVPEHDVGAAVAAGPDLRDVVGLEARAERRIDDDDRLEPGGDQPGQRRVVEAHAAHGTRGAVARRRRVRVGEGRARPRRRGSFGRGRLRRRRLDRRLRRSRRLERRLRRLRRRRDRGEALRGDPADDGLAQVHALDAAGQRRAAAASAGDALGQHGDLRRVQRGAGAREGALLRRAPIPAITRHGMWWPSGSPSITIGCGPPPCAST